MTEKKKLSPRKKITTSHSNIEHGKLPPQSVEFEEAVLGALMLESTKNTKYVINFLKIEDFYKENNQKIYTAIQKIIRKEAVTDILLVTEELRRSGDLENIGGPYHITQLTSRVASSANIVFHARIIKQKALQRQVIQLSHKYNVLSFSDEKDVFEILDDMTAELKQIRDVVERDDRTVTTNDVCNTFEENFNSEEKDNSVRTTGHPKFDDKVGLTQDKILMIAAAAKAGKSKLVGNLMARINEMHGDISTYWVTLEDSAREVLAQYISSKIFIKSKDINRKRYDDNNKSSIKEHVERFKTFDIEFQEKTSLSTTITSNFEEFCRTRKDKFKILIIDNILSLADREQFKNNENGMYDFVMAEMLRIRQKTNALIILIHHYKDAQGYEANIKKAYRPVLSDMKGTEAFRRTPNQVILINNPGKYDDLMLDYPEEKDVLEQLFICDVGANREDGSKDNSNIIRFMCNLDFNQFEEI
jgi:replicative DNA helicase